MLASDGCSVITYKQADEIQFCDGRPIGKLNVGRGRFLVICARHKKRVELGHTIVGIDNKGQMWLVNGKVAANAPKRKV